jgi:hypothetical protein
VVTRLLRAVEALVVVVATRIVLGVWHTSVLLAAVALWWGLRAWHRIETRARHMRSPVEPTSAGPAGHAAFARALVRVADAYLTACEAEDKGDGSR